MITLLFILGLMILSSLWAIIIVDYFTPFQQFRDYIGMGPTRKLVSEIGFIDYFLYLVHKIMNCSLCLSAHIFWIVFFILTGSFLGIWLCPVPYFITFLIKEKLLTIRI